jgi:hypothetical protein
MAVSAAQAVAKSGIGFDTTLWSLGKGLPSKHLITRRSA